MKKFCALILLILTSQAHALPVGNPSEPSYFYQEAQRRGCNGYDCFNFGIGFYGDYVYNRHMESSIGRDVDTVRLFTNAGYVDFIFNECYELFATFGVTRLSMNTSLAAFTLSDNIHPLFEFESESSFSASVGGRAVLWECGSATLAVEGQYFATRPDTKRLYIAAGASSYPGRRLNTHYSEWQVSGALSYRYNEFFCPLCRAQVCSCQLEASQWQALHHRKQ